MKKSSNKFKIVLYTLIVILAIGLGFLSWRFIQHAQIEKNLPNISYFETHKTNQFPVDMNLVQGGNPFKGSRAASPHPGAHINFEDDYKSWPKAGDGPSNYPPIYAVAEGAVSSVDNSSTVDGNDKYQINIAIAKGYDFEYSIEPLNH